MTMWHLPAYVSLFGWHYTIPRVEWRVKHRLKIKYTSVIDLVHIHSKINSHHIGPPLPHSPIEHISLVWRTKDDLILQKSLMNWQVMCSSHVVLIKQPGNPPFSYEPNISRDTHVTRRRLNASFLWYHTPIMGWNKMTLSMNNLSMGGNKDQIFLKVGYVRKRWDNQ